MTFLQLVYITIITAILMRLLNYLRMIYLKSFFALKKRIVHEKDALLLSDLLKDMKR